MKKNLIDLLQQICDYYDIKVSDLISKNRRPPLPDIRHLFFYVAANKYPDITHPIISEILKRDRTMVNHAIYKYEGDNYFRKFVNEYTQKEQN